MGFPQARDDENAAAGRRCIEARGKLAGEELAVVSHLR